jgi:hypothetical protein
MKFLKTGQIKLYAVIAALLFGAAAMNAHAETREAGGGFGVIKGKVLDKAGIPIQDATVAIFRAGTSSLLKQVRSAADGTYVAKIVPGKYSVLAVAEGFNPVSLSDVEVKRFTELNFGFKLERAGSGRTLPEKRLDRNNPKWVIRASQTARSIYQNREGDSPEAAADNTADNTEETDADNETTAGRKGQTVMETYAGATKDGAVSGVNVATLLPINEKSEAVIAAQAGIGKNAPLRFETTYKYRPNADHQIRLVSSFGNFGSINTGNGRENLSQFSAQALDEWRIREGVVLVYGIDYSRFLGASDDFSISPRLGFQFDIDPQTRFRTSYTTQTEEQTWSDAIALEGTQVYFREPVAIEDFAVSENGVRMPKSSRLEFGIERVLDNASSIEANVFFDGTVGRGVGLTQMPFDTLSGELTEFVGEQQGSTQGFRLVYARRINGRFSMAAGYSFGKGQKLSSEDISDPASVFADDYFQTFFGQVETDIRRGTNVKAVFRLSPQATIFAIDPFRGRLAIYDPSLSILVTQDLPSLGLPFHAKAIVDARNLFDVQPNVNGEMSSLRINGHGRMVRGGILVRF